MLVAGCIQAHFLLAMTCPVFFFVGGICAINISVGCFVSLLYSTVRDCYRQWLQLEEPDWAAMGYPTIDYQDVVYYAAPKQQEKKASLDEVDP